MSRPTATILPLQASAHRMATDKESEKAPFFSMCY
jgi:hypothetical protein